MILKPDSHDLPGPAQAVSSAGTGTKHTAQHTTCYDMKSDHNTDRCTLPGNSTSEEKYVETTSTENAPVTRFVWLRLSVSPVGPFRARITHSPEACRQSRMHFSAYLSLETLKIQPPNPGDLQITNNHPPGGWLESCSSSSLASAASAVAWGGLKLRAWL